MKAEPTSSIECGETLWKEVGIHQVITITIAHSHVPIASRSTIPVPDLTNHPGLLNVTELWRQGSVLRTKNQCLVGKQEGRARVLVKMNP